MRYVTKSKNLPDIVNKLNDSSIKILECLLDNKGPLSTKELGVHCKVSSRMIQYNLEKMLNNQPPLVAKASDLKDMRLQKYTLNPSLNNEIRTLINISRFNR